MCNRSGLIVVAVAIAMIAIAAGPPATSSQPSTLLVTVVDSGARYPLTNAEVIDIASGRHRFTDERGQTRVAWPSDGTLRIRVREIGYHPLERTLDRASSAGDVVIGLSRVAYVISPVKSTSHCSVEADSVSRIVSAEALRQLQQSAEKYEQFRRTYPFDEKIVRKTAIVDGWASARRIVTNIEKLKSDEPEDRYVAGQVFVYSGLRVEIPILSVSMLADQNFWDHHCFVVRGVEQLDTARVIRLEFSPTPDVHGPDWAGAALLDSATSYLRRIEFRLVNLGFEDIQRLEGYRTFISPSPFVVIPDSSVGAWWKRGPDSKGNWGNPDRVQGLRVLLLTYRNAKPPGYAADSTAR